MTLIAEPPTTARARPSRRPTTYRWTREVWEAAVDSGLFEGSRIERIDGELIQMPTQSHRHAKSLGLVDDWCRDVFGEAFHVRVQMPMAVNDLNDPEPDIAVVAGRRRDMTAHPTTAALVVGISEATLQHDRRKARRYAAAGVADYWIVNLKARTLELHRDPVGEATSDNRPYREMRTLSESDMLAPLAAPDAVVSVRDLLP